MSFDVSGCPTSYLERTDNNSYNLIGILDCVYGVSFYVMTGLFDLLFPKLSTRPYSLPYPSNNMCTT